MADVGLAMQRALDKTENMRARASAMEELEAAGAFDDQLTLGAGQDDIDRQLHELTSQSAVDDELEKMKAELGQGAARDRSSRSAAGEPGEPGVIVRIATEGQYRLPDDAAEQLNELDNEAVAAVEAATRTRSTSFRADARARARARAAARRATSSRSPT